jgi:HlyD family secretion protein
MKPCLDLRAAAVCCAAAALLPTPASAQEAKQNPNPAPAAKAAEQAKKAEPAKKEPEKAKEDAKPVPAAPALHKVKSGEFELKVEIDGVFEAVQFTPVALAPKEWGDLTVVSVVDHGASVKKGDILAKFETEDLSDQIADLERGRPLAELGLKLAKMELEALEKTTPISLEAARRAKMESEQDLAFYEDTQKALDERDARESVKRIEQNLSYVREELDQLEKMYKEDELTEETEEIILTRTRNEVAYMEWLLETTKVRSERTLNTAIPREHRSKQLGKENLDLAWRQAEQGLPETLRKKRLEVQGQEVAWKKSEEKLTGLKTDLAALTVRAPHDGIVYYGAGSRGKWITASMVDRKLVPGGKLMPHEVMFTVVKPERLKIHASVPENRLRHLAKGVTGVAAPAWDTEAEFPTTLENLSLVPFADNTYDAVFTVPPARPGGPALFPGMNAKIRLDIYSVEKALTVPKKAVHREAAGYYVHLKDGAKRPIKVGKYNDEVYELLGGLKEGDEVKNP